MEFYNKGTLSNDMDERERLFMEAIPLCSDPEVLSRIYNNLADVCETKGRFSKALQYYRKAIKTKPDLPTPYLSVGDIFFALGDYYSAFIMYEKGLRYRPDDENSLKNREKAKEGFKKKMVIYFDINSFNISDLYVYRLQLIGESFKDNSDKTKVMITGFTCNLGSKSYNCRLSQKRAEAVAQYLKENFSISDDAIITIGKGEEDPLLSNKDKEARELNRRVEVIIR